MLAEPSKTERRAVRTDLPVSEATDPGILDNANRAVTLVPVDQLTPYKGNARTHSRKQIKQIAESIRKFGFVNPILIDDIGEIIAGHGRVAAAKHLGQKEVPAL